MTADSRTRAAPASAPVSAPVSILARIETAALHRPYPALLLLCLLLWLPGFFTLPPSDRDESRFAQATKQMLQTGDFVRIMNGTVPRNLKPIGIYWLQAPFAAAARATGIARKNPIWPYRIPSVLGGLVAVLSTFGLGRRLVGRRAALLAAGMLAASVVLTVEVHIAKTDAALLGATTVAMGLLARAYLEPEAMAPAAAYGFWLAMAAGVLLKGPITPMAAGLAVLVLLAWERRAAWLRSLRPGLGFLLFLAVVLPWFVAIGIATGGGFFTQSLGGDLAGKLAGGSDAHGAPPGLHLLLLPLLAFPSTLFVIRALPAAWRGRARAPTRFLIAWLVPSWLVFEAVHTKLPHYTLPLYPALFLLAGLWLADPARRRPPRWLAALAVGGFVLAGALLGLASAVLPPAVGAAWWIGVPGLLAAAAITALVLRSRDVRAAVCAAPLLYWSVFGLTLPAARPLWIAPRVAAALAAHWPGGQPADARFGALGFDEPSLMFLAGTSTAWFAQPAAAADFLAAGPDRVVLMDSRDQPAFAAAATTRGVRPRRFATVRGFDYSNGHFVTLFLEAD
ncbi:MAG TPA: glycosyltransferase family 39 protein [Acetobacteraceae bacterium]|nr:glycosyltransferase family 39 protein [Acetobacteraceae bacterium]